MISTFNRRAVGFKIRVAYFILAGAISGASMMADDAFDFTFRRLDEAARPGALYRLKLAVSPKFVQIFGDELQRSKLHRFLRAELSLRNPEVAKIVAGVSESTSEEQAKEILKRVQEKHDRVVETAERQIELAASKEGWSTLLKTHAGLLGGSLVRDQSLVELFELDASQRSALSKAVRKFERVKANQGTDGRKKDRDDRVQQLRDVLNDKQIVLLDECLGLADELVRFEAERMETPNWGIGDKDDGQGR